MKILFLFLFIPNSFAVTEQQARDFCAEWFPALVLGSDPLVPKVDHLLKNFYTSDAVLVDPNFDRPQVGLAPLKSYYSLVMKKYPDWSFEIEEIIPRADGFVLHYLGRAPGVVDEFRGVDIIDLKLEGGKLKISKLIGIYDRTPFIQSAKP